LQGEHVVAVLFDSKREIIEFIVGLNENLRSLHIVGEQHFGSSGDDFTNECAKTNDVVTDFVKLLVEGLSLFRHDRSCS
jgi:hypothetical protein